MAILLQYFIQIDSTWNSITSFRSLLRGFSSRKLRLADAGKIYGFVNKEANVNKFSWGALIQFRLQTIFHYGSAINYLLKPFFLHFFLYSRFAFNFKKLFIPRRNFNCEIYLCADFYLFGRVEFTPNQRFGLFFFRFHITFNISIFYYRAR